jgi:hypothetical protein
MKIQRIFRIRRTISDNWKVVPISDMDNYSLYKYFKKYSEAVSYVERCGGEVEKCENRL